MESDSLVLGDKRAETQTTVVTTEELHHPNGSKKKILFFNSLAQTPLNNYFFLFKF